jgi:hypothetical protein
MRIALAIGTCGGVVLAVACSGGGIESSCGNYFDALNAVANKCGAGNLFDPSARPGFLLDCAALAKAPGTPNLSSEIDQCANAVNAATCNNLGSAIVGCSLRGTLSDSAACASSVQCAGGRCVTGMASPTSELVCGTCASYSPVGAACGGTTNASCDPTTGSCINGTCLAFIQQGGACGATGTGSCASGLQCTAQTCQPPPTKGQACTLFCASPERCVAGTCQDPVAQGGACPTGNECQSSLTCDAQTKTCVKPPVAGANQPCGFINQKNVSCDTGLKCINASDAGTGSTCVTEPTQGQACTVGLNECAPGLTCIGNTCQVPDYTVCK